MEDTTLLDYLESPLFKEASSNATRIIAKLKSAIERQELYEAHQILRTVYFRFINSKDKLKALETLLFKGSCLLLELEELASGQDIANLFLESAAKCLELYRSEDLSAQSNPSNPSREYHSERKTMDQEISYKVAKLAVQLPDTEIGRSKFISDALKTLCPKLIDRNTLHEILAYEFWKYKEFSSARFHYLNCAGIKNSQDIANLLVEFQCNSGAKSEIDLFITQFILQFLCVATKGKAVAEEIFKYYTLRHPLLNQVSLPYSQYPLMNFTHFLLTILESQEVSTFKLLCDIYRITLQRDPNYSYYLTRIGALHFGLNSRQGGLLNNLLMSLLEDADDDQDDLD